MRPVEIRPVSVRDVYTEVSCGQIFYRVEARLETGVMVDIIIPKMAINLAKPIPRDDVST